MSLERLFTVEASSIKYGPGATRELGYEMVRLGAKRIMVLTDVGLADGSSVAVAMASLQEEGIEAVLYDRVCVEPTDISFKEAAAFAVDGGFSGFVAVGGGSTMDTAKAANLFSTYPAEFLDYVNPPIGRGIPVPGPLKPLIAIPTTAGTGSETTGVTIFDFKEMKAKTGIAHRALRPSMGIIDPDNTRTMPPMVAACTGLDVLSHALESLTAMPFDQRQAPESPALRPAYQGANPISDIWTEKAIEMVSQHIVRAVEHPQDDTARGQMMLAATYAGIGFGNSGVHLPHGMSYPVSGMVRDYFPPGYPSEKPIIPHGMSVILHSPAVFRFTAPTNPGLHLRAASLMGVDTANARPDEAGDLLADAIVDLMKRTGMPNGLQAVGFGPGDIDKLVAGTLPQHRVTKIAPRQPTEEDLGRLFQESMQCW